LQVEYGRYLLEQSAWGSLQRVESMAMDQLGMHTPKVDEIVMVR
jgi:cell division protein FtsL